MAERKGIEYEELEKLEITQPKANRVKERILHAVRINEIPVAESIVSMGEQEEEIEEIVDDKDGYFPAEFASPIKSYIKAAHNLITFTDNKETYLKDSILQLFKIINEQHKKINELKRIINEDKKIDELKTQHEKTTRTLNQNRE